jgi:hypothetical protein
VKLVDLSMPVHRDMLTFPRVPPPTLVLYETWTEFAERIGAAEHGATSLTASYLVIQNDHVGSHCDAVKHIRGPEAPGVEGIPLDYCFSDGVVLDFRHKENGAGITAAELDFVPSEGWSPRMIVHHLADSEMTSAIRLRRLIAEDNPAITGYDEELFARVLYYDRRPIEPSLAALKASRDSTASILEHLSEQQWTRTGTHSESGAYGVETWLEIYAAHAHDHADQIRRARAAAASALRSQ